MDFLRAVFVKEVYGLPQLRASDNAVVYQKQFHVFYQRRDRDLLHLRDSAAFFMGHGHETARPGRGVLNEHASVVLSAFVGIADGVGDAGIRYAADMVDLRNASVSRLISGHDVAVEVSHSLYIDTLIVGVRITEIRPEECANAGLARRRREGFDAVSFHFDDFPGAQFIFCLIAQLLIGKGLKGNAVAVLVFADEHRRPAVFVSGGDDRAVFLQDHDGSGSLDGVLRELDAADEIALLVDHGSQDLRRVDAAAAHLLEVSAAERQILFHQRSLVVDPPYENDRIGSQIGTDDQRLRICIADGSDAGNPVHLSDRIFKFGSERRIFYVVDLSLESRLRIKERHAAPARAQVGMIIRTIKNVHCDVSFRDCSEISTHQIVSPVSITVLIKVFVVYPKTESAKAP